MNEMRPTMKLRFVERVVPSPEFGEHIGKTVRILQQWWERQILAGFPDGGYTGEWRDVEVEKQS